MEKIKDFNVEKFSAKILAEEFSKCGFQATNLSKAVELIEKMKKENCTVFMSFTANMAASGLRGLFAELCRKKFVDVIITTAGSIDHDIIKSFGDYELGSFNCDDVQLHKKGINRIGNIFVRTKHFITLEKKSQKWLEEIYSKKKTISPNELNAFIGAKLNESSFLHWAGKNGIPVFCPGPTDGAIGLQEYFFKQKHKDFAIDVTEDLKKLGDIVLNAGKTGGIVLGGGISKHHLIASNILRDGLDYSVYVSTASEYDGSLSGAQTHEAKSWGKLRENGKSANVVGDATILFPIIFFALKEKGRI